MIRINLLKNTAVASRTKSSLPKWIPVAGLCIAILGVISAGLWYGRGIFTKKVVEHKELVANGPQPSTFVKSTVVEETVKDLDTKTDRLDTNGALRVVYQKLPVPEKMNYEKLFAQTVFEKIITVVPADVGLHTLVIDSFYQVKAVGRSSSRSAVSALFSSLTSNQFLLLPPPASYIGPSSPSGSFTFAIAARTQWGINYSEPKMDISLQSVPFSEELGRIKKKIAVLAQSAELALEAPLGEPVEVTIIDNCKQSAYVISGTGTFPSCVSFVQKLSDEKLWVAFKKLSVQALAGGRVTIHATILITTKK